MASLTNSILSANTGLRRCLGTQGLCADVELSAGLGMREILFCGNPDRLSLELGGKGAAGNTFHSGS